MAELGDEVRDILAGDATLLALLTGGVLLYEELGRIGISRDRNPELYDDTTGALLPHAIVRARDQLPVRGVQHDKTQARSVRQMVDVMFYDDSDAGYSVVEQARQRVYVLLAGKKTASGIILTFSMNELRKRDYALDHSVYERSEYQADSILGA